ncbi:MAG: GNAT family N-acetyltransferase [Methylococcaceae bacterium]
MITIRFIEPVYIHEVIPLLMELNPSIDEITLQQRLNAMLAQGYQCVGIFDNDYLIGISGLWLLVKYYIGRHIELDNVYLKAAYRNQGIGRQLVAWIDEYAKAQGCVGAELNCYLTNIDGHRFWEGLGYEKIAFHFQKKYP